MAAAPDRGRGLILLTPLLRVQIADLFRPLIGKTRLIINVIRIPLGWRNCN